MLSFAAFTGRPLRTDWPLAAVLGTMPFALTYGLVYWGEQYIPSGLTAVLFGVLPLYVAILAGALLPDEPISGRLLAGVLVALGGLALAFAESIQLGSEARAPPGAAPVPPEPIRRA